MKKVFVVGIICVLIVAIIILAFSSLPTNNAAAQNILDEQDLQQLGIASDGIDCRTEEYQTGANSPLAQYSFCNFTISNLNGTEVVLELQKFTNFEDLNGTYQYQSSHLYSAEGLISENDLGDQSRFRVNNENDYGGQLNEPGVYYYNLWVTKNLYLIHVTSKGSQGAGPYITEIGRKILSKF